jgi:DNA-binding HxlR family transcriptional regulator
METNRNYPLPKNLLPVKEAIEILHGKWRIPIIAILSSGNKRFKEMKRELNGITPRMLSIELKDMEANQLIKRTVYNDTVPAAVEYSLTPYSKSLSRVIEELRAWRLQYHNRAFQESKHVN